jgi:hypothetical protein
MFAAMNSPLAKPRINAPRNFIDQQFSWLDITQGADAQPIERPGYPLGQELSVKTALFLASSITAASLANFSRSRVCLEGILYEKTNRNAERAGRGKGISV